MFFVPNTSVAFLSQVNTRLSYEAVYQKLFIVLLAFLLADISDDNLEMDFESSVVMRLPWG